MGLEINCRTTVICIVQFGRDLVSTKPNRVLDRVTAEYTAKIPKRFYYAILLV